LVNEIESRFGGTQKQIYKAIGILAFHENQLQSNEVSAQLEILADHLNLNCYEKSHLESEFSLFKEIVKEEESKLNKKLKLHEIFVIISLPSRREFFPSLYRLYSKAVTIPVTTAGCERSFSTLKRIKSYLRSKMTEDRLNDLAIISIENDFNIDIEDVIDTFAYKHSRKIEFNY
jgi:hypothetical protein